MFFLFFFCLLFVCSCCCSCQCLLLLDVVVGHLKGQPAACLLGSVGGGGSSAGASGTGGDAVSGQQELGADLLGGRALDHVGNGLGEGGKGGVGKRVRQ